MGLFLFLWVDVHICLCLSLSPSHVETSVVISSHHPWAQFIKYAVQVGHGLFSLLEFGHLLWFLFCSSPCTDFPKNVITYQLNG